VEVVGVGVAEEAAVVVGVGETDPAEQRASALNIFDSRQAVAGDEATLLRVPTPMVTRQLLCPTHAVPTEAGI